MSTIGNQDVVVGIDGSPASDAALAWAVLEATRRGLPLHCFGASEHDLADEGDEGALPGSADLTGDPTGGLVDAAVASARRTSPGLAVTAEVASGYPAATLVALSEHADTIVLGNRGRGALVSAMLGSVAWQVTTHARCPVVVVRAAAPSVTGGAAGNPAGNPGGNPGAGVDSGAGAGFGDGVWELDGVVVGVDSATVSDLALELAFQHASVLGCRLDVVHAWWTRAADTVSSESWRDLVAQEELGLAEAVAGWAEKYPDVEVHRHLPVGPTVQVLVQASRHARLLVVGSRGRGGFRRLLLGSVGQGVLHHASCSVAVVPTVLPDPFGT